MSKPQTLADLKQGNTEEVHLRLSVRLEGKHLTIELFNEDGQPVFTPDMDAALPGFKDTAALVGEAIIRQSRIIKAVYPNA